MAELAAREFISKKGRTFTIRSVNATEAVALNQFMQQCALESQNTYNVPGVIRFTDEVWATRLGKDADHAFNLFIGIFDQGRLIGTLSFYQYFDHPWAKHIGAFGMMILQEFWGEGLGKELLRLMEVHAKQIGFTRIEALVRSFNENGIALYKNAGFKIEGTRRQAAFIDGKYHDEFHIGKILDGKYPKWTPPTLTTERLILRAITLEDVPALFEYAKNENITRFTLFETHVALKDSLGTIKNYFFPNYDNEEPEAFAICLKSDPSKMIGTVGSRWASKKSQCMEMGYALSEDHWNQGILTEAAKEVIRYCFEEYSNEISPVTRIQAHCKLENIASARVMEKIGMQYEATHRQRVFSKGRFWDMKVFAILKEDWLKNRNSK